jgi:hypothetical protein
VSHLDLAPTLAAVAGIEPLGSASGVSLLGTVDPNRLRVGVAMTDPNDLFAAAARGARKVIVSCSAQTERLYDLAADPLETRDVGGEQPATLRSLLSELRGALGGQPCDVLRVANGGTAPAEALTDEQVRQLQALGYLGGRGARQAAPTGLIWADPDPAVDCTGLGVGETTIHWDVEATTSVEIRLLPGNQLFASGGAAGSAATGRWVKDGMEFAAVDATSGRILAVTKVTLTRDGCQAQ